MCEKKQFKYCPSEIDECMKGGIEFLNRNLPSHFKILACCCGHGEYSPTIVIRNTSLEFEEGGIFDLFSQKTIWRKKKFYKKNDAGYYYIPEAVNG